MRISFAALSLAFMLSIGCGGTQDTTTTATTPDADASAPADAPDAMTTETSEEDVDPADVKMVKLELPGMT